jgi:hypothetical protein
MPGKYQPLADWLTAQPGDAVTLTFAQVEQILDSPLPTSARVDSGWWLSRRPKAPHFQAWHRTGWEVAAVDRRRYLVRLVRRAGGPPPPVSENPGLDLAAAGRKPREYPPPKYQPLARWLGAQRETTVTLTFSEVEAILGTRLPASAWIRPSWWQYQYTAHPHIQGWRSVGWEVVHVDRPRREVTFVRTEREA